MEQSACIESISSSAARNGNSLVRLNCHLCRFAVRDNDVVILNTGEKNLTLFVPDNTDNPNEDVLRVMPLQQQNTLCHELYEKAKQGEFLTFICPAFIKDGTQTWVQAEASFLCQENGELIYQGIVTELAEITKMQYQLEKEVVSLKEKNRALESLYHHMISGIAEIADNPQYTLLYADESFFQMTGYTAEDFLKIFNNELESLLSLDETERTALFHQNNALGRHCHIKTKDRGTVLLKVDFCLTDGQYDGAPVFRAVFTDTSTLGQQEQESIRQQYFASLIASGIAGGNLITKLNTDRTLISYSDSLLKLLGYSKNEFSEITHEGLIHLIWPDDRERINEEYNFQTAMGDTFELEYRVQRKDKTIIWVMEKGRRVKDIDSEPVHISMLLDITNRKAQLVQLLRRTQVDSLTNLYNREYARQEIKNYLYRHKSNHSSVLFVLDLDNFKHINDYFGHMEGDNVLIQTGNILNSNFRSRDVLGRLGGDEFIAFMKDVPQIEDAEAKARQLCEAIENGFAGKYEDFQLSVSIGGIYVSGEETTYFDMFRAADMALYQAKFSGKKTWRILCGNQVDQALALDRIAPLSSSGRHALPRQDYPIAELLKQNFLLKQQRIDDERYRIIADHSNTMIFEWNSETERTYISPQLQEYILYNSWQNIFKEAKATIEGVHDFDAAAMLSFCEQINNGAPFTETTVRLLKKDETYTWCRIAATVVRFEDGQMRRVVGTVNDVDESVRTMRVLRYHAEHDLLTGYSNFEKFKADVEEILSKEFSRPYSLWYCDIKNFKYINDIYGYDTGDKLLQYWAKIIADTHSSEEPFARISADHFTCLKHYESREDLSSYFQTVSQLVGNFEELSRQQFKVELAAGIYCIDTPEDILSVQEMMDRANIAQKSIKSESGSRFALYSDEMRKRVIYEKTLEAQMENALQAGSFAVYLQAQIDIQKGYQIVGAEALARWKEPLKEIIPPAEFIPLFERNGFIIQLDFFVFHKVCQYISDLLSQGKQPRRISVNVSRITMMRPNFAEEYDEVKRRYGIPNGILELECTESIFSDNYKLFASIIQDMRRRGFYCAMDDFGTGYSSLTLLKDLPIDVLKLDMMFFRQGDSPQRDTAILRNVISMAKDLNMRVVAEGVETIKQVELLKSIGCDCVQGCVFFAPMPMEEFDFDAQVISAV
ncbi:MAG: bifunctional diguanylate cyclase/phosphodiesterase [Christensenellales bacterium]